METVTNEQDMDDYFDTLFTNDPKVIEANLAWLARMAEAEAAEKAANAARVAERAAMRCPKCMGEGRIAHFTHIKGGVCFQCRGSGVFAGYALR